jgi:hypothetical protein
MTIKINDIATKKSLCLVLLIENQEIIFHDIEY